MSPPFSYTNATIRPINSRTAPHHTSRPTYLSPSSPQLLSPSAPQPPIPQGADRGWGWGWGRRWGRALRCGAAHLRGAGGFIPQETDDFRVVPSRGKVQRCVAVLPGKGKGVRNEVARGGRLGGGSRDSAQPYPRPNPLTPHSCAHCAISYQILEACVSPRLEERLGTSSVAVESREVQRRPLVLPRGGDGHNPHAVSGGGGLAGGSSDPPHSHIARGPRRTLS